MYKTSKRIKLEKEIFSKSIKDIEEMFSYPYHTKTASANRSWDNTSGDTDLQESLHHKHLAVTQDRLDLPAGVSLMNTKLSYNCINMDLFLSDTRSEPNDPEEIPVLPLGYVPPAEPLQNVSQNPIAREVLLHIHEDADVEEYSFGLDLKLYLPRINLERDLKRIDQMYWGHRLTS